MYGFVSSVGGQAAARHAGGFTLLVSSCAFSFSQSGHWFEIELCSVTSVYGQAAERGAGGFRVRVLGLRVEYAGFRV